MNQGWLGPREGWPCHRGGFITPAGEGRAASKELHLGVKRTGTQVACSSHSHKGKNPVLPAFSKEAPRRMLSYVPRREARCTHQVQITLGRHACP